MDLFAAETVINWRDHPSGDENIDVADIPREVGSLGVVLRGNAPDLPIYCFGERLVSIEGCSYFEAKVQLTEPIVLKEHEGQVG